MWDLETGKISMVLPGQEEAFGVAFSPDGTRVATAVGLDAVTWDAQTGKPLATLAGHTGDVVSIAYSPDGQRIATGGDDGTARVWDAATGESLLTLAGHSVSQVAFTPDGDRLLTGGTDGTTRLWDVGPTGGRDWLTVPGPAGRQSGVAFSPDGTTFAVPGQVSGVTIRDIETGAKIMTLQGSDARIRRMAFSPDGTRLAGSAGSTPDRTRANSTAPVWDVTTGELVMTLRGHDDQVSAVAYSPDGRRIATGSWDGTVRLWDAASGKELRVVDVGSPTSALAFSPDGRYLVSGDDGDQSLLVWDADTLQRLSELRGHTDIIQDVAFRPDGKVVTASWDGTARIWDLESRREIARLLIGHNVGILGVAVSPDGALVATGSMDASTKLWDPATGKMITLFDHSLVVNAVAFSPDGRFLASVSGDGTVALDLLPIDDLMDLARDRVTRTLTDEECRQFHVANCPKG